MVFRITNAFSEEDYNRMAEMLSDRKALEDDRGVYRIHDDELTVRIIDDSELDIPLAKIGERFQDGQVITSDCESYNIKITAEYESRENEFPKVFESMKGTVPAHYTARFGKKTVELSSESGNGYRVSCLGILLMVSTLRERKINPETLKTDIESVSRLTEWLINSVYATAGSELDLELLTHLKKPRMRSGLAKRRRLETDIGLEKPSITFAEIGGCDEAKSELTLLGHGLKSPESFQKWGIRYPRGILLNGPPGTGKTLLAKAMANLAQASLFCVSLTDVMSCWYGESPRRIGMVFDMAKKHAPSIILFDEIDSLARSREDAHEETVRMVSVLLQKMDGVEGMDKVTVIGTTNSIERMDHALLRPGRFDKIISVPPPDKDARVAIFKIHAAGKKVGPDVDYGRLAAETDGMTGADISEIIQMSLGQRLKEELTTGNQALSELGTEDLMRCVAEYRKRGQSKAAIAKAIENSSMYA